MTGQQERTADVLRDLETAVEELHEVTARIRAAIEAHERDEGDERK